MTPRTVTARQARLGDHSFPVAISYLRLGLKPELQIAVCRASILLPELAGAFTDLLLSASGIQDLP